MDIAKTGTGSTFLILIGVLLIGGIVAAIIAAASSKKPLPVEKTGSYFDGGFFAYFGINLLANFVTTITLGIAYPWMACWRYRWQMRHTVVCGNRLHFDGRGVQLIGRYLLWLFLTIITLGIYGLWMGVSIRKWLVKHTHIQGNTEEKSYFDGGAGGYLGIHLLAWILTIFTIFIGKAWADKMIIAWETRHTVVSSRRHVFSGTGGSLFGKYILWGLLTIVTLGVFSLFLPVKLLRWQAVRTLDHEHTPEALAADNAKKEEIQRASLAYRTYSMEDETELLRTGITETTKQEILKDLAKRGLRSAQYEYVRRYGRENITQEPFASMLAASAHDGFTPAMYDYAMSPLCPDPTTGEQMLLYAANRGYIPAMQVRLHSLTANVPALSMAQLREAVRWHELLKADGIPVHPEEELAAENCRKEIRRIESSKGGKQGGSVAGIVFACIGGVLLLGVLAFLLMMLMGKELKANDVAIAKTWVEGSGSRSDPYLIDEIKDIPTIVSGLGYFPEDAYFRMEGNIDFGMSLEEWADHGYGSDWSSDVAEAISREAWLHRIYSGHLDTNGWCAFFDDDELNWVDYDDSDFVNESLPIDGTEPESSYFAVQVPELDEETAWELANLPYFPYYYFQKYGGLDEDRSHEITFYGDLQKLTCYAVEGCNTLSEIRQKFLRHMTEDQAYRYLPDDVSVECVVEFEGVCYLIPNNALAGPALLRDTMSIAMAEEGLYCASIGTDIGGRSDFWIIYDEKDGCYKLSDIVYN